MSNYITYIAVWIGFMALIAGVTLLVPKISKKIDVFWNHKKEAMKEEKSLLEPTPNSKKNKDSE